MKRRKGQLNFFSLGFFFSRIFFLSDLFLLLLLLLRLLLLLLLLILLLLPRRSVRPCLCVEGVFVCGRCRILRSVVRGCRHLINTVIIVSAESAQSVDARVYRIYRNKTDRVSIYMFYGINEL